MNLIWQYPPFIGDTAKSSSQILAFRSLESQQRSDKNLGRFARSFELW
jgi:hypothetical protein